MNDAEEVQGYLAFLQTDVGMVLRPIYALDEDDAFERAQAYARTHLNHLSGEVVWVEIWNHELKVELATVIQQLERHDFNLDDNAH